MRLTGPSTDFALLIRTSCGSWRKAVGVYQNRECRPFAQLGNWALDAAERPQVGGVGRGPAEE